MVSVLIGGGGGGGRGELFKKSISWPIRKSFEYGISDIWFIILCNYFGEKNCSAYN